MFTFIEILGEASLRLWLPVLGWTVMVTVSLWALNRTDALTPRLQYVLRRTLLVALPLGLLLSIGSPLSFRSLLPADVVYLNSMPAELAMEPLAPSPELQSTAPVAQSQHLTWMHGLGVLTVLALLAGLLATVRLAWHLYALHRFRRSLRHSADAELQATIDRLARQQGLRMPVTGVISAEVNVPLTFGWHRPVIVVPQDLSANPDGLRMALAHELVHIRWHDYAWHAFERFISALFVVHPLVRRLCRAIETHRELACDAEVLAQPWTSRRRYAALLLSFVTPPTTRPLALGIAPENKSQIRQRINAMTARPNQPFFSPKGLGLLLTSFVLGAATIFVVFSDWFGTERETIIIERHASEAPSAPDAPLPPEMEAFLVVEEMPELIGGLEALTAEIRYPQVAKKAGIEGRVFIQFIVDAEGNVTNPTVLRGIGGGCDEEAVRALRQMTFLPGKQRGRVVPVKMSVPVTFKLSDEITSELPPPPPPAPLAEDIFVIVEQMPELIGGLAALQAEITYPRLAKDAGIEGRVFVQFVVGPDGRVANAEVVRGIGGGCDEEALRAVREMRFRPGKQRRKAVPVKMSLPVTFKLPGGTAEASSSDAKTEPAAIARIQVEDPAAMGDQLRVFDIKRGPESLEGVIRDAETDAPIAGVNVIIEGTTTGAVTDLNGRFVLRNVPDGYATVNVSHVSYERLLIDLR